MILCYGSDPQKERLLIQFKSSLSGNIALINIAGDNATGTFRRPIAEYPYYIDMLRNEKPLFAALYDPKSELTRISTSKEPVGEEEED